MSSDQEKNSDVKTNLTPPDTGTEHSENDIVNQDQLQGETLQEMQGEKPSSSNDGVHLPEGNNMDKGNEHGSQDNPNGGEVIETKESNQENNDAIEDGQVPTHIDELEVEEGEIIDDQIEEGEILEDSKYEQPNNANPDLTRKRKLSEFSDDRPMKKKYEYSSGSETETSSTQSYQYKPKKATTSQYYNRGYDPSLYDTPQSGSYENAGYDPSLYDTKSNYGYDTAGYNTTAQTNYDTSSYAAPPYQYDPASVAYQEPYSAQTAYDPSSYPAGYTNPVLNQELSYYNYGTYENNDVSEHQEEDKDLEGFNPDTCKSLYIGNLSPKVTDSLLFEIFNAIGPVETCKVIKDKITDESLGYGFIDYYDHETALNALNQLHGGKIYNTNIKVNWAFAGGSREDTSSHYHIFVGDLGAEVDDSLLWQGFSQYKSLSDARVMWDQNTGKSRGYGFVAFRKKEDAISAMNEMHSQYIGSRPVRINWANQKLVAKGDGPRTLDYKTVKKMSNTHNKTVYVGNLTPDISKQDLTMKFARYGELEDIRLISHKGIAFVKFVEHDSAARSIVGMDGERVGVKMIRCSWGREQKSQDKGPKLPAEYGYGYTSPPPPPPQMNYNYTYNNYSQGYNMPPPANYNNYYNSMQYPPNYNYNNNYQQNYNRRY
eukprot:TRINITY_DN3964_c0_g1_i1.p1 TRINITY_DN3964_c0_g1~~TRINITY_DN3964_c0_g1_i1.p1  ORF type:complete len:656 (-),score=156.55 TRINITY_DN3964_c0_g1_i1:20-1987(-)